MSARLMLPALLGLASCAPDLAPGGQVLYVAPPADGEWDDPDAMRGVLAFTTIQDAVDAASSGDTVAVPAGTYLEDVVMADGVTVQGAGQGQTYVVGSFSFTSLSGAGVESLSLYDSTWYSTGTARTTVGIDVDGGEAAISDVEAYYFLHAISVASGSDVDVDGVRLGGNLYGVVDAGSTDLSVTNSFIYSNLGGGIATSDGGSGTAATIAHNTLVSNGYGGSTAYLTGAISMGSGGTEAVYNNILTNNYYGLNCYSCGSSWGYNLVWGNTTGYVNDASSVSSDLSTDPQYADTANGDYGLAAGSPCIDAGSSTWGVSADLDGESRPQGSGYDIGMDEYASSSIDLLITEVMANAATEGTGEFVEVYNAGSAAVDLDGLVLTDGDRTDTLQAYSGGSTVLAAGDYAVILDSEYASDYAIDSSVVLMTTGDTNLGNGLTTSDPITLYEADGATVVATYSHVGDPGDGVSRELVILANGDAAGNWRDSQCSSGSSPGDANCFPPSGDPADLVITEVMANPATESTGEYVEVYNPTTGDIDLAGLVLSDGDSTDTLTAYQGGSTLLGPGQHGLILDEGYSYDYYLPTDVVLVSAGTTLGNGLAMNDDITLYDTDGTTTIDTYTAALTPSDGESVEKVDYTAGDTASNWALGTDASSRGASPARLNGAAGGVCDPLLINEVMANADDEDTGEFIEIVNLGWDTIDLAGLVISDGDEDDTLQAYDGGSTLLAPGGFAVVVDAEYASEYSIPSGAILVTTGDTTLGNSLSVADPVTLYEADGVSVIDSFLHPTNPGNAVSVERVALAGLLDDSSNWTASTCAAGASPGDDNCVASSSTSTSTSSYDVVITEIMANADVESTGEFIEVYNNSSSDIDLLYWVVYDGDAVDTILGFSDPYDTVLPAGGYAIILDSDYNGDYASTLASSALVLTTDDGAIGSGLSTSDEIYLYDADVALVDSFTSPSNPGNAISIERVDINTGDVPSNWADSTCSTGSSPGQGTCP